MSPFCTYMYMVFTSSCVSSATSRAVRSFSRVLCIGGRLSPPAGALRHRSAVEPWPRPPSPHQPSLHLAVVPDDKCDHQNDCEGTGDSCKVGGHRSPALFTYWGKAPADGDVASEAASIRLA